MRSLRLIRSLILIAIIVLLALAWISRPEDFNLPQATLNQLLVPIYEMEQIVDPTVPKVADELETLKNDISAKVSDADFSQISWVQAYFSSFFPSKTETEIAEEPVNIGKLSQHIEASRETLRQLDAHELADRMNQIYEQLRKRIEANQDPTELHSADAGTESATETVSSDPLNSQP